MSPRRGGEADKLGNRYEGAWTVLHILEVIAGRAQSLTVEELGDIGKGAEFTLRRTGTIEVHQVKRQRGSANFWNLGDLRAEDVLKFAQIHVSAGRQFHFVSTIPARTLEDLAELARHSPDVDTFVRNLTGDAKSNFNYLSSTVYDSAPTAWKTLRGTFARWPGEQDVRNWNAALAGLLLTGAPAPAAAVTLADLAFANLSNTLDRRRIGELLTNYELALATPGISRTVAQTVESMHASWKSSVERELLSPVLHRKEADEIAAQLFGESRCLFAIGAGGSGKSAVLHGVVEQAESQGWAVLGFRLDREDPFSTTYELGQRAGLGMSPASALAGMAGEGPSLLVVDQLDAVSKASGRMPLTFDAVADLIRESTAFPQMRVLLACRKFDHDNDDRIRTLIQDHRAQQVLVAELEDEQVAGALGALGVGTDRLTRQQRELLRVPLHLKLLATIADQTETFSFTTTKELFDSYWDRKRRDCRIRRDGPVRFAEVVATLADEMSARQRLTVPVSVLDDMDLLDDADVLASEHVLVRDGQQLRFFHETFFDYAFARRWMRRGQTLVQFLLAGEQELFLRTQVRQIFTYIREEDAGRFVIEMESLLGEPRVRFHIKHVAFGLLRTLQDPSVAERQMIERLFEQGQHTDQLASALRSVPWFDRLDTDGVLAAWLASGDEALQNRVLTAVLGAVKQRPDRLAALLTPRAQHAEKYPDWLRWIARFADVDQSRALFDQIVSAVTRGEYDDHEYELFMSVHNLGQKRPEWAIELLVAYLVDRPGALALDSSGHVSVLRAREHRAIELVTTAAAGAPASFCLAMVPYMLTVLALTADVRSDGRIVARHFVHPHRDSPYHELEDALTAALVGALRAFIQQQPEDAKPLLDQLAADTHEPTQWLLYEGLSAAGDTHADFIGELLLREDGLDAAETWTVQRLISATSSQLDNESFSGLEQAVLAVRPTSESSRPSGRTSFTLLSAMDENRLSETARRRLGELRRLFGTDQPTEPIRARSGFMGSPITQEQAQRMSDEHWLRAMTKHNADREDWTSFRGGAVELSRVLKEEVKKEPGRFARLHSLNRRGLSK